MNAPQKPPKGSPRLPPRPTGDKPEAGELVDYVMTRFPKTMARLAE